MVDVFVEQLRSTIERGGFVMPPLVVAAAVLWWALGYRMVTLRRGSTRSVRKLIKRYRSGWDRRPRGIIDTAVVRGLAVARQAPSDLRRHLDEAFGDLDEELRRYGTLVQAIVAVAPLTGLLGTVAGMVETFDALGDMSLFSQSGGIAGGISQALLTTQMGLAVAIPGLIVGRLLRRRQELMEVELATVKDTICSREEELA